MDTRHLPKFDYYEPRTLEEAMKLLAEYGNDAKLLAGGTDLLVDMKVRRLTPKIIIDMRRIPNLGYIDRDEKWIRIGSLTTIREIEKSDIIKEEYTALFEAARLTGGVQVRNMATIGGNLCTASPSADVSCCLMALGASLKIISLNSERVCPVEDFFIGPKRCVLKPSELLKQIQIPRLQPNTQTAFQKIGRTGMDLAKVNVAVALTISKEKCEDISIAIGSCAPTIIRARKAENFLKGKKLEENIINKAANVACEETKPITDLRSTAEYREHVSKVLVKQAIRKARDRLDG